MKKVKIPTNSNKRWLTAGIAEMQQPTKPPLGLRPRWIAEEERLLEIIEAGNRYLKAGKAIPKPWLKEMAELVKNIRRRDQ
jgi:hypothetical protein